MVALGDIISQTELSFIVRFIMFLYLAKIPISLEVESIYESGSIDIKNKRKKKNENKNSIGNLDKITMYYLMGPRIHWRHLTNTNRVRFSI